LGTNINLRTEKARELNARTKINGESAMERKWKVWGMEVLGLPWSSLSREEAWKRGVKRLPGGGAKLKY